MWIRKYYTWMLGELLHLANSYPRVFWKNEFYQIKDNILELYGEWEDVHLQHIVKPCYACNGEGMRFVDVLAFGERVSLPSGKCFRCGGSGKFDEFWTVLAYYRLGDRHFHSPESKHRLLANVPDLKFGWKIEGYIEHETTKYYLYAEAAWWLALMFNSRFFWEHFGKTGYRSIKFTPMVILSTWIFNVRGLPDSIRGMFRLWSQRYVMWKRGRCQHEFPWSEEPSVWDECRKCGIERLYTKGYEGVPF